MSDEKPKRNLKEKFWLENLAPMRWADLENAKLWWTSGSTNVKSKKECNPEKDAWENYPVINVLLYGKRNIFFFLSINKA